MSLITDLDDVVIDELISDGGHFLQGLQCSILAFVIVDGQGAQDAFHDKVSLLFQSKVLACALDGALEGLCRDSSQLNSIGIDVADSRVQYLANLLFVERLIDILVQELAHETKSLDRCKSVLVLVRGRILSHSVQEVVPQTVGHLDGGDNRQCDACILQGITVLALEQVEQSFLDEATHVLSHVEPQTILSFLL